MSVQPPEPTLTSGQMIDRAIALRPLLIERQAETEALTYYSQDVHEEFLRAGFYRILVPRRYGGRAVLHALHGPDLRAAEDRGRAAGRAALRRAARPVDDARRLG